MRMTERLNTGAGASSSGEFVAQVGKAVSTAVISPIMSKARMRHRAVLKMVLGIAVGAAGIAEANAVGFTSPTLQAVSITSGSTIDISQYGAVGDGRKDDTSAIQSAFNYLKANGGTLNFKAGRTYVVSKALALTNAHDFMIRGNGATIKMANGVPARSGNSVLFIDKSYHFGVADLTVDGNRATRTPAEVWAHNVLIRGSKNFSFSKVSSINGIADGFYVQATYPTDRSTYTQNGLFVNCRADNSYRQGMSIINGENIQVIGGVYSNTRGTAPEAGIDIEPNSGSAVPGSRNILVRGVKFVGNHGYGVQLTNIGQPTDITIEGSYFGSNDRGAVSLMTASTLIRRNTFENVAQSWRGLIDLPAARTNSNNVITENSFNNIRTGKPIVYAHQYSGSNNKMYANKLYNINGPTVQSATTGFTASNNTITSSPTYPAPVTQTAATGQ